ncbi:MAG TPA: glycosyltransferase 87 family protein [Pyrinomonadaceae bacterium]|nr:glycosyltransferase 87 family protein [Pyrinomonadaceae bacterium]
MSDSPAMPKRLSAKWMVIVLSVLGVGLLILYRIGVRARDTTDIVWFLKIVGVQAPLYLAAVWLSLRSAESRTVVVIGLAFAAFFRLSILFSAPYLSDDIYRYIWDGRVQAASVNPYRYIPADPSLTHLRDQNIYPKINRRETAPTMYPPVAEAVWFLTTRVSESVTWMKVTMVGFEAIAVWAIMQLLGLFGLARQRVLIYAWHPLTVWEFAGSGHLDAIVIAFIALALLARRRNAGVLTGVSLACATLVKFFPAVLFPAVYKRWNWKMPLALVFTIVVAYLPYLGVGPRGVLGYLPGYASEKGIISGEQFLILASIRYLFKVPTTVYVIAAAFLLTALCFYLMRNQERDEMGYVRSSLIIASVFMLLLTPHYAWYFAWLIPFVCFIPSVPVLCLTLSSFLLYLTWVYWTENQALKIKAAMFLPFLLLVAIAGWWRMRRKSALSFRKTDPAQP